MQGGASLEVQTVKNLPAMQEMQRGWFNPWVGKTPWRRAWQPTPVFLPGESHKQRNLVGYSPWGPKRGTRLKQLRTYAHTHTQGNNQPTPKCRKVSRINDLISSMKEKGEEGKEKEGEWL